MTDQTAPKVDASVWRYVIAGVFITLFMFGGIGVWAARTEIAGAVIAPGVVVVETNVKKVQHPSGGVVGEIHVKNGTRVEAGDLLLKLDETQTRASRQMIAKQIDQLSAREARLKAERDDAQSFAPPASMAARMNDPEIAEILNGETALFRSRRNSITGQIEQLAERARQFDNEATGIRAQIAAKKEEIRLIVTELDGLAELEAKQLVTTTKIAALRREKARLEGELGQYEAALAQAGGRKAEVALQIVRLQQEMKTDVVRELRETQTKIAEFTERLIAADDLLRRVEIRAPQSGIVHQLSVFTVGGVVNPSEPILLIVPEGDRLVVEARIAPKDIDQLHRGQKTSIHFTAFDQHLTPRLEGELISISPDLMRDPVSGEPYFNARIAIAEEELHKLGRGRLQPGMPADVQIKTTDRTALSYLVKPLADQATRAFRER